MSRTRAKKTLPTLGYGDYLRFSRLVHERYALNFPEKRRADLEQGVRQAFAASTCEDLDEYYRLLLDPDHGAVHLQRLVNALTIGESHFFRNRGQFDALYHEVLPEIIERRRSLRTLRIWSAGCAGGQEPYSIAILLRELLPDVDDWAITILATDVNTKALDRARKGLYSEWAFREDRAKRWRYRYFQQIGKRFQIHSDIRQMVTFKQLNLAQEVADSSQRTVAVSRSGRDSVEKTIESMGQIKERVEGIAENILALSEQTQQIGEITAAVSDIASQSNMLALNASVMVTEEGSKVVDEGVQRAAEARGAIEQLASVINQSAQIASQVVAGGQQQASGVDQIATAMDNINQAMIQGMASTRQAEKSAQDLNELASALDETVQTYKLNGDE